MNKLRLLIPILLTVVASCATNETAENKESQSTTLGISYEVDTVMVNAGAQFFFLNYGLSQSDPSEDRKLLYNLNPRQLLLEVIDLDSLKFNEAIQLEREGPNGVGNTIYRDIQVLDDGSICMMGTNNINIVSPSGELIKSLEFDQLKLEEDQRINYTGKFTDDGKFYACVLDNRDRKKAASGIAVVDMETDSITVVEMDLFRKLKEYEIKFDDGNGLSIATGDSFYLSFIRNELIISSSAFNEVYRYQLENDSMLHQTYNSSLTANERIANFPNEVSSQEEFYGVSAEVSKQVHFAGFMELPNYDMNLRVSSKSDRMIGDSVVYKQFITLFDEDFKMLTEKEIENFHISPQPFVKDGMLYSFLNMEDELAFVRLKTTINHE